MIEYEKHGFFYIYYLPFLFQDTNYSNHNFINYIIQIKLSDKVLDFISYLTKLVKIYILDSFCKNIDLKYMYIKDKNNKYGLKYKICYFKKF